MYLLDTWIPSSVSTIHRPYKMWFYRLFVVTAVLHSSAFAEGSLDEFTKSMCRIHEECTNAAEIAEHEDVLSSKLQLVCQAVAHMLKERDVLNCGKSSLLVPDKEKEANPDHDDRPLPLSDLPPSPLSLFGRTNYFSDCSEIHTALAMFNAVSSGVHDIDPLIPGDPISVYCDQTTDGGGWTVIQRRFDGSIDFNRPYDDFRYGFGSANGEQWLGLENVYRLTHQNAYELYVELEDWHGTVKYAKYSTFSVGDSSTYFRLSISGYSGTAGDGFGLYNNNDVTYYDYINDLGFSARNRDNDLWSGNCAGGHDSVAGAWWYNSCSRSALNGPYLRPSDHTDHSGRGIFWYTFDGGPYRNFLKKSKMMVRPVGFQP